MNIINLKQAVTEIKQACSGTKNNQRSPFFFVVGAGISHPPIPLAHDLVKDFQEASKSYGKVGAPPGKRLVDEYAYWFEQAYPQRIDRQSYLRETINGKPISHANLRLAHLLLSKEITNLVVTPNFDDFLTRSLQLFGEQHIVCDHPSTVERIDHEVQDDIQLVYVHGTYWFYDCCNLTGEIEDRAYSSDMYTMGFLLDQVLYRRSPLVIGYSGWEGDVIMQALERRLKQGGLPRRIYWFCYKEESADSLPTWLRRHPDVYFVAPEKQNAGVVPIEVAVPKGSLPDLVSTLSSTDAINPADREVSSQRLSAQQVFEALIESFELPSPELTANPLEFFANQLRRSLPMTDPGGGESDIYYIDQVIKRIESAREREKNDPKEVTWVEQTMEKMRDAIRRSEYRLAINVLADIPKDSIQQFGIDDLREVMAAASTSARNLSDNSQEKLDGYDLVIFTGTILMGLSPDEVALRLQVAEAMVSKGGVLSWLDRSEEEIAVYDDVVRRFGRDTTPALCGQVARAHIYKGLTFFMAGRFDEAITVYDAVVQRFGDTTESDLRIQVARALVNKGQVLDELKRSEEAIAVYDAVVQRFNADEAPALRAYVAKAMVNKGLSFSVLDRNEEAITAFDDVMLRFGDATANALRAHVARAMLNKGLSFAALDRSEEAITVFDDVVQRFGDATAPALRTLVARAMVYKGNGLYVLNRSEEAIAAYEAVVLRFGDATAPALRTHVARAMVNKGHSFFALDRSEEAIAAYEAVVQRFGDATEHALREQVARALNSIGFRIIYDAKRLWAAGNEASGKELLLRANEKLHQGLLRAPENAYILGNLGYISFLSGRQDEARELLTRAISLGGEKVRKGELDDADIHALPQDEAFKELVRSIPLNR